MELKYYKQKLEPYSPISRNAYFRKQHKEAISSRTSKGKIFVLHG
jgi:hypothetical protein